MDIDGADSKLREKQSSLVDKKATIIPSQSENVEGGTKSIEQGKTKKKNKDGKNFIGGPSSW